MSDTPYIFQMPFTRQRFPVSYPEIWHVAHRLTHMYITFSRTGGQCNSILWVFALRSFICLLQTRLFNLEGAHVNE